MAEVNRRSFLRMLGLGATATAAGIVLPEVEPIRRFWAMPRNAPVGGRSLADLGVTRMRTYVDGIAEPIFDTKRDGADILFAGEPLRCGNSGLIRLRAAPAEAPVITVNGQLCASWLAPVGGENEWAFGPADPDAPMRWVVEDDA